MRGFLELGSRTPGSSVIAVFFCVVLAESAVLLLLVLAGAALATATRRGARSWIRSPHTAPDPADHSRKRRSKNFGSRD